jgi:hypothetical protein
VQAALAVGSLLLVMLRQLLKLTRQPLQHQFPLHLLLLLLPELHAAPAAAAVAAQHAQFAAGWVQLLPLLDGCWQVPAEAAAAGLRPLLLLYVHPYALQQFCSVQYKQCLLLAKIQQMRECWCRIH